MRLYTPHSYSMGLRGRESTKITPKKLCTSRMLQKDNEPEALEIYETWPWEPMTHEPWATKPYEPGAPWPESAGLISLVTS